MSDHDRASELLGVYALDALDMDEALLVELHVANCEICRAELDQHLETAGALGTVVESPPEELWERIATQLPATRPATVVDLSSARRAPRSRGWLLGAVAAAVIVVLALGWSNANTRAQHLQSDALSASFASSWRAALATPGHRVVELHASTGTKLATIVVTESGTALLSSTAMPALSSSRTYQLWIIDGHQPVSIGLMGAHPTKVTFAVGHVNNGATFAVTNEPAGGSIAPSAAPLASGVLGA
jgi:anti-sigma-K factor RskA